MSRAVSYSQLNHEAKCPWSWGLKYQGGYSRLESSTPKMDLGSLIHDALAAYHGPMLLDWNKVRAGLKPQPDPEVFDRGKALTDLYIHHYEEESLHPPPRVLATEWPLATSVRSPAGNRANYLFIGWVDLIEADSRGRLWIWDHKTGESFSPVVEMAQDFQLSTYAWALRQMGATIGGVVLNLIRTTPKTEKERFVRDYVPKLSQELDRWGEVLYDRCRALVPPSAEWRRLPKHTGRDCSWCFDYDLCVLDQTGQTEAFKDMLKGDYRKRGDSEKWLKAYNRKLPAAWLVAT